MNKLFAILIMVGVIILGFIMKIIELNDIKKRIDFTVEYRNKFIDLINQLSKTKKINQELYMELTSKVKAMQYELGSDGIFAGVIDNLKGFKTSNYQLLINFLPELRMLELDMFNSVIALRIFQASGDCDDMFIRHIGSLEEKQSHCLEKRRLFNPFSCFAEGIRFVVSLPILILNWFGFISDTKTRKLKASWIVKVFNVIFTLFGLFATIISLIVDWNDFIDKIVSWVK